MTQVVQPHLPAATAEVQPRRFISVMATLDSVRAIVRRRHLASDARAGIWSRSKARNEQLRFIAWHRRSLAEMAAVAIAVTTLTAIFIPDTFLRGFVAGAGLFGTFGFLTLWVVQASGTAPQMMGELAEQWTASELRPLRRYGWRLVNHFALRTWDIDHLLVGPGGALVVETKWSAQSWVLDPPDEAITKAVRQVESNARDVRLWTNLPVVEPVVILWGPEASQLPPVSRVHNTTVVAGPHAGDWRNRLPRTGVTTHEKVDAAWRKVDEQVRRRDPRDDSLTKLPPSAFCLYLTGLFTLAAAGLGFYASAQLLRLPWSVAWGAPACAALALLARPARSNTRLRYPSLGWQTGTLCAAAAVIIDAVLLALR